MKIRCSVAYGTMEKKTLYVIAGIIGFAFAIILLAVLVSGKSAPKDFVFPEHLDSTSCHKDFSPLPVILVSLDGFPPRYLERGVTPTLNSLKKRGSSAAFMAASNPTLTFPNHYSIVTGLYPESHGIVGNRFYDPVYNESFYLGSKSKSIVDGKWWGGDPIWNTVRRNNMKSAANFWPGSEAPIGGQFPHYYLKFNKSMPLHARVDQVIEWLSLPAPERPSWISLYSNEPDSTGHKYGPESEEVTEKLKIVDNFVEYLLAELSTKNLLACVNIIIVTDHGMATGGEERVIHLENYLSKNISNKIRLFSGPFPMISLKEPYKYMNEELELALSCKSEEMLVFRKHEMPKRFHISNNRRFEDYILVMGDGYSVSLHSDFYLNGLHGYDSHDSFMHTIFLAYGPSIKENFEVQPFQNVELYNLMCRLLNIEPSPNNGTNGLLDVILRDVTGENIHEKEEALIEEIKLLEQRPATLSLQLLGEDGWKVNYDESDCSNPETIANVEVAVDLLNMSSDAMSNIEEEILPWGTPSYKKLDGSAALLFQPEHITGYSKALKMPMWTAFVVNTKRVSENSQLPWIADVRLGQSDVPSCTAYSQATEEFSNVTLVPLFQPAFTTNENAKIMTSLISNSVLLTTQLQPHWDHLMTSLVPRWFISSVSPLHVIAGPIFDNNTDGWMDDIVRIHRGVAVPTNYFAIVTRCTAENFDSMETCPEAELDSIAFVYPQSLSVDNCFELEDEFATLFRTNIKDIERLTGLTFFPNLTQVNRLKHITKEYYGLW